MSQFIPLDTFPNVTNARVRDRLTIELVRLGARLLFCCWLAIGAVAQRAAADVKSFDDVWIQLFDADGAEGALVQDNPLTLFNEGINPAGNKIDVFQGMAQTNYEGRPDISNTTNVNFDVIVGRSASAQLVFNGEFSVLRAQDMIIGDIGPRAGSDPIYLGNGIVRIEGNGALFNNDPNILPYPLTASPSVVPRETDVGFDLYVGRNGTGLLRIALGGRAEIQDATIVGDLPGSQGTLIVDGFDSLLSTGGFDAEAADTDVHQTVIGHFGTGVMNIVNGGQVFSDTFNDPIGNTTLVGAVIGGEPYVPGSAAQPGEPPEPGGLGIVTLSGANSRWIVKGTLQVGGFHDANGPFGPDADQSEGDNVLYGTSVGRGTLNIGEGTSVSILPLDLVNVGENLRLAIGRFGRVILTGGQMSIGANVGDVLSGSRDDQMALLNDGLISGGGRIDTGILQNRYLGEIEVGVNQHLIFDASAEFDDPADDTPPLVNWGVIRVIGNHDFQAELEFERTTTVGSDPPTPFQNRALTVPPAAGRVAGLIRIQDGTIRFRTGIVNQGTIAFTGGENRVVGNVDNLVGDTSLLVPNGVISVTGVDTRVLFENDLINSGMFDIAVEAQPVDILGDYVNVFGGDPINTGTLSLELVESAPDRLDILGDGSLGGTLQVSIVGASPTAGDIYGVLSATGDLSGIFHSQIFPTLAPTLGWIVDYDYILDTVTLRVLSTASIIGADFNGDGVVDLEDLAIWRMNFGIVSGATGLQGDADGDGDVDGFDYILWQRQLGPVPGSGSGSGAGGTVPEPGSSALLVMGLIAFFVRRRQR